MARRRSSAFDDFIFLLSRLPWWVSMLLALVSWLVLHPIATAPPSTSTVLRPGDMGGVLAGHLWRTFACRQCDAPFFHPRERLVGDGFGEFGPFLDDGPAVAVAAHTT